MSQSAGPSYTRPAGFVVDDRIKRMIAGAVAEVDPRQIAILRKLTPAQRVAQAVSMIEAAEQVAVYRLCLREPELNVAEAQYIVRSGRLMAREVQKRAKRQS